MGICSRLYKLCHIWVNQIEDCYHMLYTWSNCFPSGLKLKEQQSFEKDNNLQCDQHTMKHARTKYSNDILSQKSSIQHKVHLESYLVNQTIIDKVQIIQKEEGIKENVNFFDDMELEDLGGKIVHFIF